MRLSKLGYYGDFAVYPVVVAGLATAALWRAPAGRWLVWLVAFVAGVGLWTLIEYLFHRFVFHRVPFIRDQHKAHHDDQHALIGTPIWLSFPVILLLAFLPLRLAANAAIADALTAGLVLGYFWYVSVHHIVHHWPVASAGHGFRLRRRHLLHHHYDDAGNFGVSSGFWDRVFGTEIVVSRRTGAVRRAPNR